MTARTSPSETLARGAPLRDGAFVVEDVLSQSHFAITYRGRDTRLARAVAIKEYFPLGCSRRAAEVQTRATLAEEFERAKNQFLAEARVLAQFHHPGIVAVFDFFAENNTTYMVMEFLEGHTLEDALQNGPLPVDAAVGYILQIGAALQTVHEAALLHCDVKPENVMVSPLTGAGSGGNEERVVLVDFGLTKRLDESRSYNTRRLNDAGHFGTPGYAPIEQYTHSTQIGAYTDVYALGATLYRLLTNEVPTPAADRAAGADWQPPHILNPRVSRSLSQAIAWAMQLAPAARPATVDDWLTAVRAAGEQERLRAALLATLRARIRQGKYSLSSPSPMRAAPVIPPPAIPAAPSEPEYLTSDAGCLHACFVGCLVVWFIAAAVSIVGFGLRLAFAGG